MRIQVKLPAGESDEEEDEEESRRNSSITELMSERTTSFREDRSLHNNSEALS